MKLKIDKIQEVKRYTYIFLWTQLFPILIYIINGYKNIGGIEIIRNIKAGMRISFILCSIFFIIIYLTPSKLRKILGIILILFNLILNVVDLGTYINFGTQINPDVFFIALETNMNEGMEFIKNYINFKTLILIIYIWEIVYLLKKGKTNYKKESLVILGTVFLIVFSFNLEGNDYTRKYILSTLNKNFKQYKREAEEYKSVISKIQKFNLENEILDKNKEEVIYVLVIGESSSKSHFSIYDYKRVTNPKLEELKKKNELIIFEDVITPYPVTREALQIVLTLKDYENKKKFYEVPSILDIFNSAGFKTYWLSNQEVYGAFGNVVSSIASKAEQVEYTEIISGTSRKFKKFDESLISLLDKVLEEKQSKKFIVLHLMGNHMQYQERYPEKFKKFNKSEEWFNKVQNKYLKVINNYDNSVLYTDEIISEIIRKIDEKNKKAYVLYFSDHGEEVYDEREFMGHTLALASKYMAEIPFFLWLSDEYKTDQEKTRQILKSINNKYTTEDLPYTLLDLSYIDWEQFDSSKSIINENFKEKVRIHGEKNYDTEIKNNF